MQNYEVSIEVLSWKRFCNAAKRKRKRKEAKQLQVHADRELPSCDVSRRHPVQDGSCTHRVLSSSPTCWQFHFRTCSSECTKLFGISEVSRETAAAGAAQLAYAWNSWSLYNKIPEWKCATRPLAALCVAKVAFHQQAPCTMLKIHNHAKPSYNSLGLAASFFHVIICSSLNLGLGQTKSIH